MDFKKKFYPCQWANYDDVLKGKCKLVPNDEAVKIFCNDYVAMKNMIYGDYPRFDEIIYTLRLFEKQLNESIEKQMQL